MIRLFTGFDRRESIGHAVFCHSVLKRASQPVSIIPVGENVSKTDGTNAFTLSRFKIPELCSYSGWAIWMDGSDMLCMADLAELWEMRDESKAIQVVQHNYKPTQRLKYLGTDMQAENKPYPRKNWSSVMLINASHKANLGMTLDGLGGEYYHRFGWLKDEEIGELPKEWNYLVSEPNQCSEIQAKIAHATNGGWWLPHYSNEAFGTLWRAELHDMLGTRHDLDS